MPEVALFVDLENILTSLWRNFQQGPDTFQWIAKARKYGPIAFARAYGDFGQPALARILPDLRAAGIEPFECPTKQRGEMTQSTVDGNLIIDLFELAIDRPTIDTVVLMAGDSDYLRVVTRLRNRHNRRVIISGVPGSVSRELVRAAGEEDPLEPVAVPMEATDRTELIRLIDRFEASRHQGVLPVYSHLLRYATDPRNSHIVRPEIAQQVLNDLVREGVLRQFEDILPNGTPVRVTQLDRDHEDVIDALEGEGP